MKTKKFGEAIEAAKTKKTKKIDPQDVTELHIVSSGDVKGWLHTHGMAAFGKPELEMRGVPLFLAAPAAELMNHIADYLLNSDNKTVKVGETMQMSEMCIVRFVASSPINGDEEHFESERWEIVDAMTNKCARCDGGCDCDKAS